MAEEVIQEEAVEAVEAEEVNTRFNMEGTGYVNPGNVYTHCDRIPYPWQEELEQALNIAGGHVKYGIGNPEDEFCSEEDLKAWIEARRDSDELCAFPLEQDCISQADRDAGKKLSDENGFKGFTIMEWKDIPESESPWENIYEGGQDEWKEKYTKVYGFEPEQEVVDDWPDGLALEASKHEKEQLEIAISEGKVVADGDSIYDTSNPDYIPPSPDFHSLSKEELVQYGEGIGIELDKELDEEELINIIYDHEHPAEESEEAPTEE